MQRFRDFLKRKDIEISLRRYGIDALGAMAQGLFCSLLIGTILNTLGQQFHIGFLNAIIFTLGKGEAAVGYTIGGCASLMVGPAMAVAIGHALHAPAMVLFSLVPVGFATNAMGGAGGPLAVLVTAVVAAEFGKAVSKETKVDILVTPIVTILVGIGLAMLVAGAHWQGRKLGRQHHHVGDRAAAVRHGHHRVGHRGHRAHAADLVGGHLRGALAHGACGRRGRGRLLREHGGLCRAELP